MIAWSDVTHFSADEFTAPEKMQPLVVLRLDRVREDAGVPIYITSSYRDGDKKSHGRGWAVDISDNMKGKPVSSRWRSKVLRSLAKHGFTRVGVYDKHLHADLDPSLPAGVTWWGTSS